MDELERILLYHNEKNLSPSPDFWTPFLLGLIAGYFTFSTVGRAFIKREVKKTIPYIKKGVSKLV